MQHVKRKKLFKFVNFNKDFIFNAQTLTALPFKLIAARKTNKRLQFTAKHFKVFEEIKRRLCAAPKFAHLDFERPIVFYNDALRIAIGAEKLQQCADSVKFAKLFFLIKLSLALRNYSTFQRECMAIVYAFVQFCIYILGRKFRLRTDHCFAIAFD